MNSSYNLPIYLQTILSTRASLDNVVSGAPGGVVSGQVWLSDAPIAVARH